MSALLKGDAMTMYQKLFLALVWDRVDIAEEKILSTGEYQKLPQYNEKPDNSTEKIL